MDVYWVRHMKLFSDFFTKSHPHVCLKMSDSSEKKMKEAGASFYRHRHPIVCKQLRWFPKFEFFPVIVRGRVGFRQEQPHR